MRNSDIPICRIFQSRLRRSLDLPQKVFQERVNCQIELLSAFFDMKDTMLKWGLLLLLILISLSNIHCAQQDHKSTLTQTPESSLQNQILSKVSNLKITTLSTMLANRGIGEWG